MNRALSAAATGMQAQQANIDRVSNDISNVNTDGYKKSRIEFKDLMYQTVNAPGENVDAGQIRPVGVQAGSGVKVGASYKMFEQGPTKMTYHPFDVMIDGKGFFPVERPNGEILYTRTGSFHLNQDGGLSLSDGSKLIPEVTIPNNARKVTISSQGEIRALLSDGQEAIIGQIQLITFQNEQGLTAEGSGLYNVTSASGPPNQEVPGENGTGLVLQGALEGSNVNVANSMIEMISAQRAYEMGAKVMKVADDMMSATINIK
mgnify:CR=1 FL=1